MKTHTIKTPTAELLIVEMPEGAKIRYYTLKDNDFDGIGILQHHQKPYIITGSYTLLGKPDEISEKDMKELVENKGKYYKNYSPIHGSVQGNITFTAKESLLSLIESEIYWDMNPLSNEIHAPDIEEWHEAQEKTFDKNRTLIFKKN